MIEKMDGYQKWGAIVGEEKWLQQKWQMSPVITVSGIFNNTRFCILSVEQNATLQFIVSEN